MSVDPPMGMRSVKSGFGVVVVGIAITACGAPTANEDVVTSSDALEAAEGDSRNIEFEQIKNEMQKLNQMQQTLPNEPNTLDELAKSAIRTIKD